MNQSLNSSFDSFIENFFQKNDSSITLNNSSNEHGPNLVQELNNTQRNNIVLLSKLVIKELFKHRSKVTLTDECKTFFDHLFVCLERFLQHGLKQRKQMFGVRFDPWSVIELIEKISEDVHDITESARNLPRIKTSLGKTRAWFRLAMMKKKLSDFFQLLVDNRKLYKEYYEPYSLIFSEDANVITGLLVGLNSFEYNVYIKDELFDLYDPIIDMKYYLKDNNQDLNENGEKVNHENGDDVNMQNLVDQNSYIEEINKHLKSQIKDLELKIDNLTENKSSLSEESSLNKVPKSILEFGTILANKEKQLLEENKIKCDLEKRLADEINLRNEAEVARDLLENDIQEKQDTIITLRDQLDEVKTINIQIFKKLQEKENELIDKNNIISECESKIVQFRKEVKHLDKKLSQQNDTTCSQDLLNNYQKLIDEQQEQMTQMQQQIDDLKMKVSLNNNFKEAYNLLKKKYDENELALEEIGKQLQDSKLEIENLREYSYHLKEAAWTKDSDADKCKQCNRDFTLARRKHHCRSCGDIFCGNCSNNEMPLPSSKKPVRVCDSCHTFLLERCSHSS